MGCFLQLKRWRTAPLLAAALLASTSCSLHEINPQPHPIVEPPARFVFDGDAVTGHVLHIDPTESWWRHFGDPVLDQLVEESLQQNLDLRAAMARLAQATAITRQSKSVLFPELALEARSDGEIDADSSSSFSVLVGPLLSWELDFFRRNYSEYLARGFAEQAAVEDYEAAKLILSTAIVNTYYETIEQKRQLALLQAQVGVDRELLELIELRFKGGLVSTVDVLQQRGQLAETESLIPIAEARAYRLENQIDVLLGRYPDGKERVKQESTLPLLSAQGSVALPVEALLDRPDIRAERLRLVSADAEIGRAIADRFPRLMIEGGYGYANTQDDAGFAGTLQSIFTLPLLDWGRRRAEVTRNEALYDERLARFTAALIRGVQEVEDTLYLLKKQAEFLSKLEARREILTATVEESRLRYSQGLTDYLPVLDAVQELRQIERELLTEQRELVALRIQLHRAIGGPMGPNSGIKEVKDEALS